VLEGFIVKSVDQLPFDRVMGTGSFGLTAVDTVVAQGLIGRDWLVEDDPGPSNQSAEPRGAGARSGVYVHLRLVRNTSGITLLPGRLVVYDPAAYGRNIIGYPTADGEESFPVDWLGPAAGVANNDCFYIIIGGRAKLMQPASAVSVAPGDKLMAALAATRTTTTGGRFKKTVWTLPTNDATTLVLANNILNGRWVCLDTNNTNNALVNVEGPLFR
jgi:hypothetical protein